MKRPSLPGILWRYAWASPWTLVGLLLGLAGGGSVRRVDGCVEFGGGRLGRLLAARRIQAVTLGHAILGATPGALEAWRRHEQVHVRQYERWGPLFVPAYGAAALVQLALGGDPYRHNPFEQAARAGSGDVAEAPPQVSPRRRLALFVAALTVGVGAGVAGYAITGSEAWFLAIPVALAVPWWFLADPTCCTAPQRPDRAP